MFCLKEVQKEIIKLAILDCKEKAKLIAESAGVKLRSIKSINYGYHYSSGMDEIREKASQSDYAASGSDSSGSLIGFTPNNLLFLETVLITWKIK